MYNKPPGRLNNLQRRITDLSRESGVPEKRLMRVVANSIVAQMLPDFSLVKGGTGIKFRLGDSGSRFTADFDAARPIGMDEDEFIEIFRNSLNFGWNGFSGTISPMEQGPVPSDVPEDYLMTRYKVNVLYAGKHWMPVIFELGRDEVGSTSDTDAVMSAEILHIFRELGLPDPSPVPVMVVAHQIAQKLHACTSVRERTLSNDRAHDLVDIQLLDSMYVLDLSSIREVCLRLFRSRRRQAWPPTVVMYEEWDTLYADAAADLDVLPTVQEAVVWINALIVNIARQEQ